MSLTRRIPLYSFSSDERQRIDTARGFLCFYVFCFHYYSTFPLGTGVLPDIIELMFSEGYVAVQVFFAVSGFLIFHSYAKISAENPSTPVREFFLKRLFRIFPAWLVALSIYSLAARQYHLGRFLWDLFLLFGLSPLRLEELTMVHSWSLYVEELFYLSFPIFIFFFVRKKTLYFLALFLIGKILFQRYVVIPAGHFYYTPFTTFQYFAYGIVAYLLLPTLRRFRPLLWGICYLSLALALWAILLETNKLRFLELFIVFWLAYIVAGPTLLSKALNFCFSALGKICYSFYLMHILCIWKSQALYQWLFQTSPSRTGGLVWPQLGLAVALALSTGFLLYYFVERNFIHLGRRLLAHRQASAGGR